MDESGLNKLIKQVWVGISTWGPLVKPISHKKLSNSYSPTENMGQSSRLELGGVHRSRGQIKGQS